MPALQTCYWELSSYLNNNGDSPTLFKLESGISAIVDTYTYSSSSAGLSYERIPDGGNWTILQNPTKSSNKCTDLAPTATPAPTSVPTNTPAPTNAPTSAPTPTPTRSLTFTPVPTLKVGPTSIVSVTPDEVFPTSILGESVSPATQSSKGEVKGTKTHVQKGSSLPKILLSIGGIFLIACGILTLRKLKIKNEK